MTYLLLAIAITSEVIATTSLKLSAGFTRLIPSLAVVIGYAISFLLLSHILTRGIPIGIVYAIWAGAGVGLVAIVGRVFLGDQLTSLQIGGLVFIVVGVVALELGGRQ